MPFSGAIAAGAELGADVAAPAAFGLADAGAVAGADAGLTAAALDPTLTATIGGTAEAGLGAANAAFGTFDPALFAANSADVAAGGFGTDLVAAGDIAAGGAGEVGDATLGLSGDLMAQATGGPDVFGGLGGEFGGSQGVFADIPGATDVPAGATGSWMDFPGGVPAQQISGTPQAFGAAGQDTGPMVSSEASGEGVDDPGQSMDQTFNQFGATSVPTQSTTLESAFPGATKGIVPDVPTSFSGPAPSVDSAALQSGSLFNTGGVVPGTGVEAAPGDFTAGITPGATQTAFTPGGFDTGIATANVTPSAQMIAGAPDVGAVAGGPSPVLPGATNVGPGTVGPAGATPGAATTAAAGGGVSPLTALRYGTAGLNLATAGINLTNALNQPSYSALMPGAYPGSPYAGPIAPGFAPGTFEGGGVAGGLAGNRLVNGLVSGQSPQQLAQQGIIPPARAAQLQSTYTGIEQQYAAQLGVSPQSLSPGVRRMIAAQALADQNLGGR